MDAELGVDAAGGEHRLERRAFDHGHRDVHALLALAEVTQGDHVGVRKRPLDARLTLEACPEPRVARELVGEDLQCHRRRVEAPCAVDDAHRSGSEHAIDPVTGERAT